MEDKRKTQAQILEELKNVRRHVATLEAQLREIGGKELRSEDAALRSSTDVLESVQEHDQSERQPGDRRGMARLLFENMSEGVAIYEAVNDGEDFVFVDYNIAGQSMDGTRHADVIGRRITAVFPGVKEFGLLEVLQRVWRTGEPERHPTHLYRDNKKAFYRDNRVYRLPGGEIVAVYSDSTERKRSEEQLSLQAFVLDQIQDRVTVTDLGGVITYVNDAEVQALGYHRDELIGASPEKFGEDPERGATQRQILEETLKHGEWRGEVVNTTKDGHEVIVDCRTRVVRDDSGEAIALCGVATDITERKEAEDKVSRSESRLVEAQLVAGMGDFTWDIETGRADWSEGMYELLGYDKSEKIDFAKVNHPDDRERITDWLNECLGSGKSHHPPNEYRLIRKDGEVLDVQTNVNVRHEDGKPIEMVGTCFDITEHKRAKTEKRQSDALYQSLLNSLSAGVVMHAPDTSIVIANPAASEILGLSMDQMLGREASDPGWKFLREDSSVMPLDEYPVNQVLSTNEPLHNLVVGVDRPGTGDIVWALVNGFRVKLSSGQPDNVMINFIDITERKQAEDELRKFKTVSDEAMHGAAIADLQGNIIYANDSFARVHGYAPEELLGKHLSVLHNEKQLEAVERLNEALFKEGQYDSMEVWHVHADGTEFPMLMSGVVITDENGAPQLIAATAMDISTIKQLEEEGANTKVQLAQAQKMESVGRLAGGIAHDFNNLLTVIENFASFAIEDLKEDAPMRDDLQQIRDAGRRAATLTRQLLAFSRKQPMDVKILELNTVVAGVDKMLKRILGEDIDIQVVLAEGLGRVEADAAQIEQILMNLAVNARDAMPLGGKLTIETANAELDESYASRHPDTTVGPHVMLAVTDTGVGMEAEVRDHIFEPFYTTKDKGKGTGLGLAMVYGIVKQSGGNIWVYSEPGQGTTFKVYLPRVEAERTDRTPKSDTDDRRGSETILVVEDEEILRRVAERLLTSAGYAVISAANGDEALLKSEQHGRAISLLFTDVLMPKMSGKELASRLTEVHTEMKVLYMSGYTDNVIAHHGILDAGIEFIGKPFTRADLLQKVRTVLDGN